MKEAKSLVERLAEIDDPRIQGLVTYPLVEILFAVLTGVLCRMEEWDDIVDFAEANLDWLRQFLPYASGIASDKTFRLVFSRIDHKAFAAMFAAWAAQWSRGGVIAIDAKTLRGTGESGKARSALHVLNAVAHDSGMILGHRPVDGKGNEITAIPEFLESLAVDGAIVTIDAMGTQKHIAATIIKPKADYVLALKGNQNSLHDDVRRFFDEPILAAGCAAFPTTDAGHGRIEERVCRVTDNIGGCKSFILIGMGCAQSWPSRRPAPPRKPAKPQRKHATTSLHCLPIPRFCFRQRVPTGALKTGCIGCSTSSSVKTSPERARTMRPSICLLSAKLPSICSAKTLLAPCPSNASALRLPSIPPTAPP